MDLVLNQSLTAQLKEISIKNRNTLFVTIMSTVAATANRFLGMHDLVIGFPSAGRSFRGLENQVGFYVNPLPLRIRTDKNMLVCDLVQLVNEQCNQAIQHELYPFDKMVKDSGLKRDPAKTPFFNLGFSCSLYSN